MELEITPKLCKEQKDDETGEVTLPVFSGTVTVKLPDMPEVFRFKAKYGKRLFKSEDAKSEDDTLKTFEVMVLTADIAEEIKPKWSKVDLKELATGREIKSVDDLYSYEPCFAIIAEVALKFVEGFAEKNSSRT